ncbi:MAG: ribonucleoside-diphosphate reductase, adenosylcobalamin-dependent, partial [Bacteroidetes bacterium]|nr:ribonucleoside-diphosphate reductase, adenosylcobalamin-dependent [Bacteroidota bacterium]
MATTKVSKKPAQKTYNYQEVLQKSITYFGGDELAASTWANKYCMKDAEGNYLELSPDDMHHRMAKQFGRKELEYREKVKMNGSFSLLSKYGQSREFLSEDKIYNYFKKFNAIIPQGSVMMALGNP